MEGVPIGAPTAPPAPGSSAPAASAATLSQDPDGRIQHLKMLRDSGLLTADEYQTLEAKLLGQD
jgi:hypothetical protein